MDGIIARGIEPSPITIRTMAVCGRQRWPTAHCASGFGPEVDDLAADLFAVAVGNVHAMVDGRGHKILGLPIPFTSSYLLIASESKARLFCI